MERKNKGQQLSQNELAEIRARSVSQPVIQEQKPSEIKKQRTFISKLKNEEISNFFQRFGYLSHERLTDKQKNDYLHIICENMCIIMNDYDIGVSFYPEIPSTSKFNYAEFQNVCRTLGISETKAIADIITSQFMTPRFPSYADKRFEYQSNLINDSTSMLSKEMKGLLSPLIEQQLAEAKMMNNVGKYGAFDIEDYLNNKFGA